MIEKNKLEHLETIMSDMAELLRNWNYSDRALGLERDKIHLLSDTATTLLRLSGASYWGGSGSYFDIFISTSNNLNPNQDNPNLQYNKLLRELLLGLANAGVVVPNFKSIKETLDEAIKYWVARI